MTSLPRVLLTGFEPFDGADVNPSWEAVKLVAKEPPPGVDIHIGELPCRFADAVDVAWALIESTSPAVVVSVGLAAGRAEIAVERVAVNLRDARIRDNAGEQPVELPVIPDGPAAYFATIPVTACVTAVREAGLPAVASLSAGTFVCNHLFYGLLHRAALRASVLRVGFVHVPLAPAQALDGGAPSMPVTATAEALRAIVAAVAQS